MHFPIVGPLDGPSTGIKEVLENEKWAMRSLASEDALLSPRACLIRVQDRKSTVSDIYIYDRIGDSQRIGHTGENSSITAVVASVW
jgi:hypothetical protein